MRTIQHICILLVAGIAFNSNAAPPQIPLTVTVQGDGTVISDPAGINCPPDCAVSYKKYSTVTLTATADPNNNFLGWSDACSGTDPTCMIRLRESVTVTALFDTASVINPASVLQKCDCNPLPSEGKYTDGSEFVQLTYLDGDPENCPTQLRMQATRIDSPDEVIDIILACDGATSVWSGAEPTSFAGLFLYNLSGEPPQPSMASGGCAPQPPQLAAAYGMTDKIKLEIILPPSIAAFGNRTVTATLSCSQ